ncbi:ceramidase domain-containing protein [Lacinutrix jangbogonensis]|uniref:ceramidase domain-containing protein n=1 Tax=Lacinutrix jangbogonensis TaxID=1469557 RepID=UPI00053DDA76|nr:ceramidase domain-containing protein [Lacinutrix jangbogonensis]
MKSFFTSLKKENIAYSILTSLGLALLIGIFIVSPIIQSQSYHDFSDAKTFFKMNNFWNVISNLPFFIVGFLGIYNIKLITEKKLQYVMFFSSILFVSIGSTYYHLNPNNYTLIFDRLPMTLLFMALSSIIISEFINDKIGKKFLLPMLLLGLFSVLYWVFFEDLSLYVFIQFYPMLVIPIVLVCFKSSYTHAYGYWLLLAFYIIAKGCEYYDVELFTKLKVISGHSIKHIMSAMGLYVLYRVYIKRRKIEF